jgi:hypothetical protein
MTQSTHVTKYSHKVHFKDEDYSVLLKWLSHPPNCEKLFGEEMAPGSQSYRSIALRREGYLELVYFYRANKRNPIAMSPDQMKAR